MSTRAVLGYMDKNKEFRGTYIHFDGDTVGPEILPRLQENVERVIEWIESGITGNGYSSVDSISPYGDGSEPGLWTLEIMQEVRWNGIDFIWAVCPDTATVTSINVESDVATLIGAA